MPASASNWNLVIVGAWNRAILTPDGIRRRLLELPDGTPIEVEIPLDILAPFRVRHEGVTIIPSERGLELSVASPGTDQLALAVTYASRALSCLPETPVSAAGVNLRYRVTGDLTSLHRLVDAEINNIISDQGFAITASETKRTLSFEPGTLNLQIAQDPAGECAVRFNFHRDSNRPEELATWLERHVEFINCSERILRSLNLEIEES